MATDHLKELAEMLARLRAGEELKVGDPTAKTLPLALLSIEITQTYLIELMKRRRARKVTPLRLSICCGAASEILDTEPASIEH